MTLALKVWYVYQMLYLATLFFVKISILVFYCRISPSHVHMSIKITGVIVTVYTVAMIFVNVSWTGGSIRYVGGTVRSARPA